MIAAVVIGNVGDVRRFRNRDHFAAYVGGQHDLPTGGQAGLPIYGQLITDGGLA